MILRMVALMTLEIPYSSLGPHFNLCKTLVNDQINAKLMTFPTASALL